MRKTHSLSITLPHDMAKAVKDKVASGAYATESEVIREGLRALSERERASRWGAVGLLYAGNVLRFIANMALIQLVIRWSEAEAMRRG